MLSEKQKLVLIIFLTIAFLSYSVYLYTFLPYKQRKISEQCVKGMDLWQKYNCNACHQVYGLGGYLGPDLTNVYSKRGPEYIAAFLQSGTQIMPKFNFSEDEIKSLLAFLEMMDKSGKADPRTYKINKDGTIEY
ncbi:MAG: cytochrome c [Bacteroidetes bacterium]|nr:cytochrome c [Bacteroidota bacterium]